QAEDGIRDFHVTGVQTCALPISDGAPRTTSISTTVTAPNAQLRHAGSAAPRTRARAASNRALAQAEVRHASAGSEVYDAVSPPQIGRASCRERVEIGAVGGPLRK